MSITAEKKREKTSETPPVKRPMYSTQDACGINGVSQKTLALLVDFKLFLDTQSNTASRMTHYNRLDEWLKDTFDFLRKALTLSRDASDPGDSNPDYLFWHKIYWTASNIHYSQFLDSKVSAHHSSAFERNQALREEINFILKRKIPENAFNETIS